MPVAVITSVPPKPPFYDGLCLSCGARNSVCVHGDAELEFINKKQKFLLKKRKEVKKKMKDNRYFHSDGQCKEHGYFDCEDCQKYVSKSISLIPLQTSNFSKEDSCRKAEAIENFRKQTNFISTVLEYDEEKMNNVKVNELPKLIKKAQLQATVGNMKMLLGGEEPGIVGRFIQGVRCKLGGK